MEPGAGGILWDISRLREMSSHFGVSELYGRVAGRVVGGSQAGEVEIAVVVAAEVAISREAAARYANLEAKGAIPAA